jgi:hypothetical protein
MDFTLRKVLLPDRAQSMRVLRGPFRGAIVVMNPRNSLRKIFGLYEHELNSWLNKVLPRVTRVLDVGANDGYFTFGCAAAFRRLGRTGEIIAFEPQQEHIETLQESIRVQPTSAITVTIVQALVGSDTRAGVTSLDAVHSQAANDSESRTDTLVKIDVEGAELEVLNGATSWLRPTNYFVIEVHEESFLEGIIRVFGARGLRLIRVDQRPLPLLGREARSEKNWWLVSDLN